MFSYGSPPIEKIHSSKVSPCFVQVWFFCEIPRTW